MATISKSVLFAACILCCPVADAQTPSAESAAERLANLVGSANPADLSAVVEQLRSTGTDPWLVTAVLRQRGASAVARRLAGTIAGPDGQALAAYLDQSPAAPASPEFEALLARANRADSVQSRRDALAALEVAAVPADAFDRTRRALARADLLLACSQVDAALVACDEASAQAEAIGWLRAAGMVLRRAGRSVVEVDPQRAVDLWRRSLEIEQRRGDTVAQAFTRSYLGKVYADMGRLREAFTLFAANDNRALPARLAVESLLSAGLAQARLGAPVQALAIYERALAVATSFADEQLIAHAELSLADAKSQLGDTEAALALAIKATAIITRDDTDRLGEALGTVGVCHEHLGQHAEAGPFHAKALDVFERAGDPMGVVIAKSNLALAKMYAGQVAAALALQTEALDVAKARHDDFLTAEARYHLGRILVRAGEFAAATDNDGELLRLGHRLASERILLRAHLNAARRHVALQETAAAMAAAREAARLVRRAVAGLSVGPDAAAREHRVEVYEIGARAALQANDLAALCWMIEAGRAGALLDALGGGAEVARVALTVEKAAAREGAVEAAGRVRQQLACLDPAAAGDADRVASAQKRLGDLTAQAESSAVAGDDLLQQRVADLAVIQQALRSTEALVHYLTLDADAFALVITRTDVRPVRLGAREPIERLARVTADALGTTRGRRAEAVSPAADMTTAVPELVRLAIDPLRLDATVRQLLVSPTGAMALVPFCLLCPALEVSYAPSGSVLQVLRARPRGGAGVLAIGAPEHPGMERLPGAEREAAAVGDTVLTGATANQSAILQAVASRPRWRAIHFACHGRIDAAVPIHSALLLTPTASGDKELTVADVLGASFPADLITLSACDTAHGRLFRSEGVVGFMRAFVSAGANSVLVSLWKVNDDATAALMQTFYRAWQDASAPVSAAAALRAAQAQVRARPEWSHPRYWAAWQLWGLPDP